MRILAIDTTTKYLCLAVCDATKVYTCDLELGTRHSRLLAITITRALEAASLTLRDIDFFACGIGPGSFTGIRVGMSAIKGMAWALHKPVVGIPTLDLLARNALSAPAAPGNQQARRMIIPAVDAKRGLIYCSGYTCANGMVRRRMPYMLLTEKEFIKKIRSGSVALGDALGLYRESIARAAKRVTLLDRDYWFPQAQALIPLARERIAAGKVQDAFTIKPMYLYPKECQIRNYK